MALFGSRCRGQVKSGTDRPKSRLSKKPTSHLGTSLTGYKANWCQAIWLNSRSTMVRLALFGLNVHLKKGSRMHFYQPNVPNACGPTGVPTERLDRSDFEI